MKHMRVKNVIRTVGIAALTFAVGSGGYVLGQAKTGGIPSVKTVTSHRLVGIDNTQATVLRIDYAPGAKTPSHHHPGHTIVYVVEGSIQNQIGNGPVRTYNAGDTFYEAPHATHRQSFNASDTEPAAAIAFMVHPEGETLTKLGEHQH